MLDTVLFFLQIKPSFFSCLKNLVVISYLTLYFFKSVWNKVDNDE